MRYGKGKGNRVLRKQKTVFKAALIIITMALVSCATRPGVDTWSDATLVAEQRAEIERLRRDIGELGQHQLEVSRGIDRITEGLNGGLESFRSGLERCGTIEDIFREVDVFVRRLFIEINELGKLQFGNWTADAGEG